VSDRQASTHNEDRKQNFYTAQCTCAICDVTHVAKNRFSAFPVTGLNAFYTKMTIYQS